MKIKYKWIFFTLTIILIIALVINFIMQHNSDNTANITNVTNNTYKFRIFTYEFPSDLKFSNYDKKHFKVEGQGWYAIVGMWYDNTKTIYRRTSDFQEQLEYDMDVTFISNIITIDDIQIITFHEEQGKSLLCYFATDFAIDYEVEIFNQDGSYKTDALNELMEPLLNTTIESADTSDFYIGVLVPSDSVDEE